MRSNLIIPVLLTAFTIEAGYDIKQLERDLSDTNVFYFLIKIKGGVVGFAKIIRHSTRANFPETENCELRKSNISSGTNAKWIGSFVMPLLFSFARSVGKKYMTLDLQGY